jgi:hypothetical protein
VPLFASALRASSTASFPFSSAAYLRWNSAHFAGSCENHFLSSVLGAVSLSHSSILALSLLMPRGQSRSTRTRRPSEASAGLIDPLDL